MDTSQVLELAHRLAEEQDPQRRQWAERIKAGESPLMALPMMGGAENPSHPLGPPVVSGNTITVDTMLNSPTRITRMIMDLSLRRFIVDRIFANAGGVSGGAVVYDQATTNELYADRDVQRIEPGSSFPLVTAPRLTPKVAEVEKYGGKVFITDEAKDRNDSAGFTNKVRQLTNTIIRKNDQRAIEELTASITASGQTASGVDWSEVVVGGSNQSNADEFPARDFATAQMLADEDELGVTYTLWLLNPAQVAQLTIIYGSLGLQELLQALKISIYSSNRVPAGKAYVVAEGQVGGLKIEKPLGTETWRDPEHERTWVQASVRPVVYVTDPFSVIQFTGLAG